MMRTTKLLGTLAVMLAAAAPIRAEVIDATPVAHQELGRGLDELAAQLHGLGDRLRGHFERSESGAERPLISLMLQHRQELGLSAAQVEALERLRADFQRESIKRDADLRVADMHLAALLAAEPVDLAKVEPKVREIERLRADARLARIRVLEQGKAELTAEQRSKLKTLVASPWPPRPSGPLPATPTPPTQRM